MKTTAPPKTIAILPFVNRSTSEENEYFSDGITEEIINALSKIKGLKVTSRTSSFFFKGKNLPIQQIASELRVSTVLEGSVRLSGETLRITAQLIHAEDDFHFWSETWDRKLENVFEVQDEISLLIADKLRESFGHLEIQDHLVIKQTDNIDAYSYSLQAQFLKNKWNPKDVNKAIGLYKKGLNLDPHHPNSLIGLADAYSFLAMTGFMDFIEAWKLTEGYIGQALKINNEIPAAYYMLANHAIFTACDFKKAFEYAQKSIAFQPNYVEGQQFLAFLYIIAGEEKMARKHLKTAIDINPLSEETGFYIGYIEYMTGNYSKALQKLEECISANPMNIPAISVKSLCLLQIGRHHEVLQLFDDLPEEVTVIHEKIGSLVLAFTALHDQSNISKYLDILQQEAIAPNGFTAHSYLFLYYAFTEDLEKAFEWVKDSWKTKSSLLLLRYNDPVASPIQQDDRYQKFQDILFPKSVLNLIRSSKKPLLPIATQNEFSEQLQQVMAIEKPYLDPLLTLRSLAKRIEIHPNQLSWLLNESLGNNFSEYINRFRIEKFKSLAQDPLNKHITLIGLAYESGFNSKTVFNTYFKKETGLTPKEYLKQL